MDRQPHDDDQEVPADLLELLCNVLHAQQLASYQEADSSRSQEDDPRRYLHHHEADALEEPEQRPAVLSSLCDDDACYDREDNQAKLNTTVNSRQGNVNTLQCWSCHSIPPQSSRCSSRWLVSELQSVGLWTSGRI